MNNRKQSFSPASVLAVLVALSLGACGQPESNSAATSGTDKSAAARLDMSKGPNKVTADDYALTPVPAGDKKLASIDADGNVAPFGMASRAKRPVQEQPAPVAAAGAAAAGPGATVFSKNCVACHGADAKGVQGLGLDLTASELVAKSSAAELVEFLKAGRLPGSPDSVTGVPMPSFAWMPQADLDAVSTYVQSL